MTKPEDALVERVALAIVQEIGWEPFSHFNPDDIRRIARAAINAMPEARAALRGMPD
jgi:hypothetical protein